MPKDETMPTVELVIKPGVCKFEDDESGLNLNIMNPQGTPTKMTEWVRGAIRGGKLKIVSSEIPAVVEEDEDGIYRDSDGQFSDKENDADGKPEPRKNTAAKKKATDKEAPKKLSICKGKTVKGTGCKRKDAEGSKYCSAHKDQG